MHDAQHRSVMAFARQPFQDDADRERGWTVDGRRRRPVDSLLHCLSSILPKPSSGLARTGAERRRERVRVSERAVSAGWLRGRMSEWKALKLAFSGNARTSPSLHAHLAPMSFIPIDSRMSSLSPISPPSGPPSAPKHRGSVVFLSPLVPSEPPCGANWALNLYFGT